MALDLTRATAGMTPHEIVFEVNRGGRFVVYQYAVSVIIMSFKRNSPVVFVKAGENPAMKSLPWTALSAVFGWWGIPWGFIYTPQVLYRNLHGGRDITGPVVALIQSRGSVPAQIN